MIKIDIQIINLIEKYPFFTDPIVLFKTNSNINNKRFLSDKLDLNYPEINNKKIEEIKKDLDIINDLLANIIFKDKEEKNNYSNKINDFYKILRIIKIFNNTDEKEKYNLINEIFWINSDKIWKTLKNKEYLINYFNTSKSILKKDKITYFKEKELNSKEIQKYFMEALKFLKLEKNWKVKIGDSTSIIHTNFNELWWEIIIPENRKINIKKLLELIIHEIDWHCLQFSNAEWLYSGSIRFSNSEILLEWYAMFLEYHLTAKYFWENRIIELINKKQLHFDYMNNKISQNYLINNYKWNIFRLFRWFKNIKKYTNLKDMAYLLWIEQTIKNIEKYWNYLDLIKKWVVNQEYIETYWIKSEKKEKFNLEKTSAIYILNKYFIK